MKLGFKTSLEWIESVNNWIGELADKNTDQTIDWTDDDEKLIRINSFPSVEKLYSSHSRKSTNDRIILWHYLIDLINKN